MPLPLGPSEFLVFPFILSFRILNAASIATFFQPDEYFQALEPAWKLAFGEGWLTWVLVWPLFDKRKKELTVIGMARGAAKYCSSFYLLIVVPGNIFSPQGTEYL